MSTAASGRFGESNPQLVALVTHSCIERRVGGPWSKPLTTPAPARSVRLPPLRAAAGSLRTTSKRRSPSSAPCCSPTMPRRWPIEKCSAGDFYKPAHGHIFGAIRALIERGEPIDAVTVTDELQRSGLLEAVGDPSVFISLQANTPSIANARHYAAIVEEHSLLRRLIGVAGEIADLGLLGARGRGSRRRRGRADDVQRRRAADGRHHVPPARAPPQGTGPHRGAGQAGLGHHRGGHRVTTSSTRSCSACSPRR